MGRTGSEMRRKAENQNRAGGGRWRAARWSLAGLSTLIVIAGLAGCGSTKSASPPPARPPATTVPPSTTSSTTRSTPTTGPASTTPPTTTRPSTTPPTTAPPSTAPTSTTTPPTTAAVPADPQPSAYNASGQLVQAWADGDRSAALTVATATAVDTLFAVPYPVGAAVDRGCSDATFLPVICTYGAPGGGDPNDSLFQFSVSQAGPGWYVSSVQIEQ